MNKIILEDGQELILNVLKLRINRTSRLTKHKVEDGAELSDHKVKENISLTLDILITDQGKTDRSSKEWLTEFNLLKKIYDQDLFFKLVTNRETLENLTITNFPDERDAENGDSIITTLTLEQVRIAKSKTVTNNKIKDEQTKDRLFSKHVSGLKTLTPASLPLTNGTNKLIDTNPSEYKPKFKL